jgi:multicomponent Na+:H+ antiporter subunit B
MKGMFRVFLAIAMIIVVGMFLLLSQKPMVFSQFESQEIVIKLFEETQATNIVSAVYLSARLYDTVFEFMVFAVAAGGVAFYSRFLGKATQFACLSDPAVAITLKLLALFAFLSGVYLAIFGHLAPGGGFAAGVAGGTALFLLAIIGRISTLEKQIASVNRSHLLEQGLVATFLSLTILDLWGIGLPLGNPGTVLSAGYIPLYNCLIFLKVTLSSWSIVYHFIQSRGIL